MYNILVVDDDREIVGAIEIYLKKEGYNIIKAYNGNEALQKVKENDIHLIILDIMMPKKDGLETLEDVYKRQELLIREGYDKKRDFLRIETQYQDQYTRLKRNKDAKYTDEKTGRFVEETEQAPKELVKIANENGGYDNITVIVIKNIWYICKSKHDLRREKLWI